MGLLAGFILFATGPGFSNLLLSQSQVAPLPALAAVLIWPTFFLMLYLFPNGKFAPRFTRFLAVVPYLLFPLDSIAPSSAKFEPVIVTILIVYAFGGLVSQVYRYRKVSTPEERQQTKWVVFSLGVVLGLTAIFAIPLQPFPALVIGTPARFVYDFINGVTGILLPALIPISIGIAILRYRLYGPDEAGRIRAAKKVREALAATPDIVGIDDTVDDPAPRIVLKVDQGRAALAGVSRRDVVETMRAGLSGMDATPLHDGHSKYEVPVRLTLPAERQGELAEFLKLTLRAADGSLVPMSELVRVVRNDRERPVYHKDLLPVVYVVADQAGATDSPLYGMFAARGKVAGLALEDGGALGEYFIRQPSDPYRQYSLKWDGEWQVTYETFRDMDAAYAVR